MPSRINYYPPLLPGHWFHVHNRGNNRELLFYNHENYRHFLEQFNEFLGGYLDVYAFSLLPDHFHFLVRVKLETELTVFIDHKKKIGENWLSKRVSKQFQRLFQGYALAINRQQGRVGSLFQKNFRRRPITSDPYLTRVIYYLHLNPVKHQVWADYRTYPFSSFARILSPRPTKLQKQAVLDWFGGADRYVAYHDSEIKIDPRASWVIE